MIQRLQKTRNEKGFTLIELLIVIIVLGILAAIVVFAVGSTRKDSVASSCKTNYKAIELSAEAVNTKMGSVPVGLISGTTGTPTGAVLASTSTLLGGAANTNGALLKTWPKSSDYALVYVADAGTSPTTFSIQVYKADSTTQAATGSQIGGGASGAVLGNENDCKGL